MATTCRRWCIELGDDSRLRVQQADEATAEMRRSRRVQIVGYLVLFAAALIQTTLAGSGRWLFAAAAAVATTNTVWRIRHRDPLPNLAMAWELGFVVIVAAEGFFEEGRYVRDLGLPVYRLISAFLVGGFSLVMAGHAMTFRPSGSGDATWLSAHKVSRRDGGIFIALLVFLLFAVSGPRVLSLAETGRFGAAPDTIAVSAVASLISGLSLGASIALPAMIGYQVLMVRKGRASTAYLLASPILLMDYVVGTRSVFLIAAVGLVAVHVLAATPSRGQLLRLVAAGLLLTVALSTMMQFRNEGLLSTDPGDVLAAATSSSAVRGDNVVGVMGELVLYFEGHPHLYGTSTLGVALFWVPRQFWPSKPTLLGYWFPRASRQARIAVNHSIAAGFGGDLYADFGFWGGLAALFGVGLAFGRLDGWASRILALRSDPWIVLVATLYGLLFFGVRSPLTAMIVSAGVVVWVVAYAWVLQRGSDDGAAARPRQRTGLADRS